MHNIIKRVGIGVMVGIITISSFGRLGEPSVSANSCPDLQIIFARGSGGERWTSNDYLSFKSSIEEKLVTTNIQYEFIDLDYPAVGVGLDNFDVTLGAYISGGEAFEFGESVGTGINNLKNIINTSCSNTKYVLGGYSQGAIVLLKTLPYLRPEQILYVATFGDPKIYLPEGEGLIPAACRGENLSDYRMYVPDCQAYKGILGAFIPYEPDSFDGKIGTWCNKKDILCSSHLSVSDHVGYVDTGLYEDASRTIFDRITKNFGIENHFSSPHDTAILIDSTGSMAGLIEEYKAEALRLAQETFDIGGRVALYEYRDLDDPYLPVKHCGFDDCNLEKFSSELELIHAEGGGDEAESLLSASFRVMQEQNWNMGSTKSLVVLTDSNYLMPDRDGITFDDVVKLSKKIDPVNFYIVTKDSTSGYYQELADKTDGLVVTSVEEFHLMTDYIIGRYDSLSRVDEDESIAEKPTLRVIKAIQKDDEIDIEYETNGEKVIVVVDDVIMGTTDDFHIAVGTVKLGQPEIQLIPITNDLRGDSVAVEIDGYGLAGDDLIVVIPKTPNTGRI